METTTTLASGHRRWIWVVAATFVAVAAWAAMWHLTVDRGGGVCPAIMPAPPGCAEAARTPVAITGTVVVAGLYAAGLVVLFTRLRRHSWLVATWLVALIVGALWAYQAIRYP